MNIKVPKRSEFLKLLENEHILEFLKKRSILTLFEIQEHRDILVYFSLEYNINNEDGIGNKRFVEWVMKREEKKSTKCIAMFYLFSHYNHLMDQGKDVRRVFYECLRKKLRWCLNEEKISQEMYEYYNDKIPIIR